MEAPGLEISISCEHKAIKREISEHLDCFRRTLSDLHGYNTRNGYLPRLPKPKTEWGKRTTYYK